MKNFRQIGWMTPFKLLPLPCLGLTSFVAATGTSAASLSNPLVGAWVLERYVDTPDGGTPLHAFGEHPIGLFVFTADGHVSVNLMRNPPGVDETFADPDPDACVPSWYCSYFGTYDYNAAGQSWTTQVIGGNVPAYLGTAQERSFTLAGDRLTISETYITADGRSVRAERILRKTDR